MLEMAEMLIHYLESKSAKDQMFLVLYEAKRGDLFHCLLLEKNSSLEVRLCIMRLLSVLLQTPRVALRHRMQRMHLQETKYLGFLHLRIRKVDEAVGEAEATRLFDLMAIFDDSTSYQGILGLLNHLCNVDVDVKLSVARRLMRILFAKPDAPMHFARQIGWQYCLTRY